jgi:hypothetical protein
LCKKVGIVLKLSTFSLFSNLFHTIQGFHEGLVIKKLTQKGLARKHKNIIFFEALLSNAVVLQE